MNPYTWGRGDSRRHRDIPLAVQDLVTERQGGKVCPDCITLGLVTPDTEPMELDHKQPLSKGGDNHHLNLEWRCRGHNRQRAARPLGAPQEPPWARRSR